MSFVVKMLGGISVASSTRATWACSFGKMNAKHRPLLCFTSGIELQQLGTTFGHMGPSGSIAVPLMLLNFTASKGMVLAAASSSFAWASSSSRLHEKGWDLWMCIKLLKIPFLLASSVVRVASRGRMAASNLFSSMKGRMGMCSQAKRLPLGSTGKSSG